MTCKCGRPAMRYKDECGLCEILRCQQPPGGTCTGWPLTSNSLAVHRDQVREGNEFLSSKGISSREAVHNPDGTLEIQSAAARKKVMRAKGVVDLDSFN